MGRKSGSLKKKKQAEQLKKLYKKAPWFWIGSTCSTFVILFSPLIMRDGSTGKLVLGGVIVSIFLLYISFMTIFVGIINWINIDRLKRGEVLLEESNLTKYVYVPLSYAVPWFAILLMMNLG